LMRRADGLGMGVGDLALQFLDLARSFGTGDKEKSLFLYGFIEIPRADMLLLYNYLFSSLGFITTLLAAA
jgi:hypothetical protein